MVRIAVALDGIELDRRECLEVRHGRGCGGCVGPEDYVTTKL